MEKSTHRNVNSRESSPDFNGGAIEFLTPEEVACAFAVDKRTILKWAREGKLECLRPSKKTVRFTRESVLSFAKASTEDIQSKKSSKTMKTGGADRIIKSRGGNTGTSRKSSWRSLREEVTRCQ